MADDEVEFNKLPIEDRCVHKLWKARVSGYEDALKLFRQIDDEKSPEWSKFTNIIKKFVIDSHAMAQEKGLEATLAYVENCAHAGKAAGDVMSGIVAKCIAAPKARTKELATQIALMYIEIEKAEVVIEELLKGMDHKNPKVVSGCVTTVTLALQEFGSEVISVKPLVKKMSVLLADRDKTVRDEGKNMIVEMYRWIGAALKSQFKSLQPLQITELEAEFEKCKGSSSPKRYLRSQQFKKAKTAASGAVAEDEDEQDEEAEPVEIDPYDLADPVDVLSKLPKDFLEKLEAKKWQERKEALELFENLLKTPKLENGDYGDIVRALKKIIAKDANIVVVTVAGKCLAALAGGLKKNFHPYASTVISTVLEKFREKKQAVVMVLREAVDAVFLSTTIEHIQEDALEALNNKNPSVKMETASFLARAFCHTQPKDLNKKLLKAYCTGLLKTLNEPDPGVRDASADALGTAMKLVGEKQIMPFLNDVDQIKMGKIKESCDKAVILVKIKKEKPVAPPPAKVAEKVVKPKAKSAAPGKATKKPGLAKSGSSKAIPPPKQQSVYDSDNDAQDDYSKSSSRNSLLDDDATPAGTTAIVKVDISAQLSYDFLNSLNDKNWKDRMEALNKLAQIISDAKSIQANSVPSDLFSIMVLRLADSNMNIVQVALTTCELLVQALGPAASRQHIRTLLPAFMQCLGDSKVRVRSAAISCINKWADVCGYKEFFEGEMLSSALKAGAPSLRSELWIWLGERLPDIKAKSISRDELINCLPYLYNNLEDRNAVVRKSAQDATLGFMIHLGFECMVKHTEKIKPASKTVVMGILEKTRPNLPIQELESKPTSAKNDRNSKSIKTKGAASKAPPNKVVKPKSATTTKSNAKKDEEVEAAMPLLALNNMKNQRFLDEQKLKILKWNFTQPREEFVELLRDMMTTANVNKNLIQNMFHVDFRYHLKALDMLQEDINETDALMANLDLILKWITLRFFDTNPSVLIKSLDYLQNVFQMLQEVDYQLLDNEAASFLPYLILKIGDSKDAVRSSVHAIIEQILLIYNSQKVFSFTLEGLKSKNARQRTECLEVLGRLIEMYGVSVCHPTPAAALKEVAKQISDRDNSVRNAALNCVVQAWLHENDKVYKLIGKISDKDLSLLEERIKRAPKRQTMAPPMAINTTTIIRPNRRTMTVVPESRDEPVVIDEVEDIEYEDAYEDAQYNHDNESPPQKTSEINKEKSVAENLKSPDQIKADEEIIGNETVVYETKSPATSACSDINDKTVVTYSSNIHRIEEPKIPQRYKLDEDFMKSLDAIKIEFIEPKLIPIDTSFLYEPLVKFELDNHNASPLTPPKPIRPGELSSRSSMTNQPQSYSAASLLSRKSTPTKSNEALPSLNSPISQKPLSVLQPASYQNTDNMSDNMSIMHTIKEINNNTDLNKIHDAIVQLESVLRSNQANMMIAYEDPFMSAIEKKLRTVRSRELNDDTVKLLKNCLMVLVAFYDSKVTGRQISKSVLVDIIRQLLMLLTDDDKMGKLPTAHMYIRVINSLCVRIIDRSDHTRLICALLTLLRESLSSNNVLGDHLSPSTSYMELILKCLWKVVKLLNGWTDDIDYDTILYEIHLFLAEYPASWWKQNHQNNDTAIRTIKTVIHTLTRIKGKDLLQHLTQVPNATSTELYAYIQKCFRHLKLDEPAAMTTSRSKAQIIPQLRKEPVAKPLSRATHNLISDIFQKIGNKDSTKEGLQLLYEFKEQHPEVDIDPYLKRSSQCFQQYIDKGLQDIAEQKRKSKKNSIMASSNHENLRPSDLEVESLMERLQTLTTVPCRNNIEALSDDSMNF